MRIVGIDEAGRGPLIGPMVMAGVLIDESKDENLINLGVKDSKLIIPSKREILYDKIIKLVDRYHIIKVPPKEIDDALNSPDINLNWLEAIKTAEIINELKPEKAFVDCPSNNIPAYTDYLQNLLNVKCELVVEHKADEKYPSSSAASILAKVTRDREIAKLKMEYGNIGSGYPSDPATKEFLLKNYKKYPEIFRRTWQSYKKVAEEQKQKNLGEF